MSDKPLEWDQQGPCVLVASDVAISFQATLERVPTAFKGWDRYEVGILAGDATIETRADDVDDGKRIAEAWRRALGDFHRYYHELREQARKDARP